MVAPFFKTTDINGIRSLLLSLLADGKDAEVVELVVALLCQLQGDNDRLQQRLAKLLHERLGHRSEKIPLGQLRLFLEEALQLQSSGDSAVGDTPDVELPSPTQHLQAKPGKRTGRRPLPADLPREEIVLEPPAEQRICSVCGRDKVCIGHERSEVLEYVPASFKVLVHARAKYACRPCEGQVVIGPTGPKPIEAGLPGFGLLADVLVKKYADHAPLHRIRGIYLRLGVDLPVSTLSHWVAVAAQALEPIARAIERETLAAHVVQADDTGLRVLDPAKKGGAKRGHMWAYVGDRVWATYVYTPTWEGKGPCTFLADRVGWLQADAYKGYDRLFTGAGATAVEVGCWAHARRYFVDALESDRRAALAIHFIGQLYGVERDATERGLDATERLALRRDKSKPVLASLGRWIEQTVPVATPKSPLGQGLTYVVNQWRALGRFLEDGRLELDNNGCERALRTIAVGRKNWLFAGSDQGAERAAVIYTVVRDLSAARDRSVGLRSRRAHEAGRRLAPEPHHRAVAAELGQSPRTLCQLRRRRGDSGVTPCPHGHTLTPAERMIPIYQAIVKVLSVARLPNSSASRSESSTSSGSGQERPASSARSNVRATVPKPTEHARAIARCGRPASYLSRRISRNCLICSLLAAIYGVLLSKTRGIADRYR